MLNIIAAYKAGLFAKKQILPNIISGIVVGVVALPLAMAFAIASGAKPEQGIYTAIIAGFMVSVFGGSSSQIAGPTGAFVVILLGITNTYGIEGLQIATLLAGVILLFFGLTRLGSIMRFIPMPVIVGFTAGIGTIIWISQWQYFFGLNIENSLHFHNIIVSSILALKNLNLTCTFIATISLLIVIYANKINLLKKIPSPLLALVTATLLQVYFQFPDVATIGSKFGGIPHTLPSFHFPAITLHTILTLIGPAFTIAMLGAIESLLSAAIADKMSDTKHNSNRELIGQGLANIVAPLFGGFAATGAIARTATNIRNGGTSPLSGIIHSITLVLIIVCLAPLAIHVPLACLAAILFWVAWNMSQVKYCFKLFVKSPKSDVMILIVTYLLTVFVDLVVAVNIGFLLAMLTFLLKMTKSVTIRRDNHENFSSPFMHKILSEINNNVLIYTIEGPLFFAAIEKFDKALKDNKQNTKVLILKFNWVPFVDGSALESLENIILKLQQQNVRLIICGVNAQVHKELKKSGILNLLGVHNIYKDLNSAIAIFSNQSANEAELPVHI